MKALLAGVPILLVSFFDLEAQAADKFDLWIDAFSIPGFSVTSIEEETRSGSMGPNYFQNVRGVVDGQEIRITIQKSGLAGFNRDSLDPITRDLKRLSKYFGVTGAQNFKRVKGPRISGGQLDYQSGRCRVVFVGADRKSDMYGLGVALFSCGANAVISDYATRIRASNRDKNTADFAAFSRNSADSSAVGLKPLLYRKCEEAKKDSSQMAVFMKELPSEQLARFLDAGQSCTLFDD